MVGKLHNILNDTFLKYQILSKVINEDIMTSCSWLFCAIYGSMMAYNAK